MIAAGGEVDWCPLLLRVHRRLSSRWRNIGACAVDRCAVLFLARSPHTTTTTTGHAATYFTFIMIYCCPSISRPTSFHATRHRGVSGTKTVCIIEDGENRRPRGSVNDASGSTDGDDCGAENVWARAGGSRLYKVAAPEYAALGSHLLSELRSRFPSRQGGN